MDVNPGDTVIIGETRFRVLAVSATHVYCRRDSAMPNDITYLPRDTLERDGVRIERKEPK